MHKMSAYTGRYRFIAIFLVIQICIGHFFSSASQPYSGASPRALAYDIDAAKALCDSLPLSGPEGIWIYPEDNVAVLILKRQELTLTQLPEYEITVVETNDVSLRPGDMIGTLSASPERNKYEINLFTERRNLKLLKPQTVMAIISDEGETMVLKKEKSKFNFRFVLNPYSLLPKTWRIIRMNTSLGNKTDSKPAVGMIKIYPAYDGNNSSRRKTRYL